MNIEYDILGFVFGTGLYEQQPDLMGRFRDTKPGEKIYFAGDTGFDELFNEIKKRFGKFCLTLLPIGSYEKRWYMETQHMDAEDAVKVHMLLESGQSIGFHYATFADNPEQTIDAHEKDLAAALRKYHITESDFWVLKFGEGRYVS
ncbi:MAG: hypothetical protein GX434_09870 [Peptococcaceae bacterium]|nr:hypothetical protein [Peptococcaceae bacterium]